MSNIPKDVFRQLSDNSSEGMIIADFNNIVVLINTAARHLLNLEQNDDADLASILGDTVSTTGEPIIIHRGNKKIFLRLEHTSNSSENFKLFYLSEIKDQRQEDDELTALRTIIDYISEGIIATNQSGQIIVYNKQLAEFEELSKNDIEGKYLPEVYDITLENSDHMMVLKSKKPIKDLNRKYFTKSGRFNQLIASTYPITKNNKVIGTFSVSRNVTKIREMFSKTMEMQQKTDSRVNHLDNGTRFTFDDIIGESPIIRSVIKQAKKAALTLSPILICGKTGTGKELFVQSIHNWSIFKEQPFVGINCAAVPESLLESLLFGTVKGAFTGAENTKGLFEQAENGTLFLDEINSMSLTFQAKLLRAIQEKVIRRVGGTKETPINCRIISSTNEDLAELVNKGAFREDLYYRIAVFVLTIPPLKERYEDMKLLSEYFMQKYARIYGQKFIKLSNELNTFIKQYSWPGNVREIEHVFESSIAMLEEEEELTIHHLPLYLRSKIENANIDMVSSAITTKLLGKILKEVEKKVILDALEKNNYNITRAGQSIGIGRQNMQYRMSKLGIKPVQS